MTDSMESQCLSFGEVPHTTKLFSAFLETFGEVSGFYAHPPTEAGVLAASREVRLEPEVRRRVTEILREQNRRLSPGGELDPATERNLNRLGTGAAAIVTGQQVALFSGPAFSFYKAASAVRIAEEITASRTEAVPIFWLATEDHDLAEVNHADWTAREGLARFEVPLRKEDEGRRVGDVHFDDAITALVTQAAESLDGPAAEDVGKALRESYVPGESYGSAFGKLMARLLAGRGIIFIDPLDARLHQLAASVYRRALDDTSEIRAALLARGKQLERAGFHAQVKVTQETTLLFYNVEGRREPLRSHNGKFHAGKTTFTPDELRAAIERAPEAFTANVLLRPVVQDTILPTAAYIGGPAEIAYMAQVQVAYEKILGRMPAILHRASFTLVEPAIARLVSKYGLELRDVFRGKQQLRSKMEQKLVPRALAKRFEKDEKILGRLLQGYRKPLEHLDKTLLGSLQHAEAKILYQFRELKEKAGRAESFRGGVLERHERLLCDRLYPHRELQERTLSLLPTLATHGLGLFDALVRHASLSGCTQHHILPL
jgi:bacillithiol biosynthesis cysteine-adding enzyme BshC